MSLAERQAPGPGDAPWDAVVLLQMGGPETLDEIEPFLERLFADPEIIRLPRPMRAFQPKLARMIARKRAPKVRPRYEAMGNGSPLRRITDEQAAALEKRIGVPVHVAMRYTPPWADEVVAKLLAADAQNVLLLPLYPHWSVSTTGSSLRDFARAAQHAGLTTRFSWLRDWGTHPGYVEAVARSCEAALENVRRGTDAPVHLLLSAHSLPERYILEGDSYRDEVDACAGMLRKRLDGAFASVSHGYQSAVGPVKWIGPDTQDVLEGLAADGAEAVMVAPLGFVSDHIETKYDMDTLYRSEAARLGVKHYARVPSFNGSDDFAALLETLARGPVESFEVTAWTS